MYVKRIDTPTDSLDGPNNIQNLQFDQGFEKITVTTRPVEYQKFLI